jgi:hypothetical protein
MSAAIIPRISQGMQIPYYEEGDHDPMIFSSEAQNKAIAVCNSLLKGKVVYGAAPGLTMSERGLLITIPRPGAGGSASTGGMFPFRVYNPTGSPANTFRVHGGVAIVEELFPVNTTPNDYQPEVGYIYNEVTATDQVYDTASSSEGTGANDVVLDSWLNGGGPAVFSTAIIWLELSQTLDSPGAVTSSLHFNYNTTKGVCIRTDQLDPFLETALLIPLALVFQTGTDEDGDLLSSYIVQLWNTQVVGVPIYPGRQASIFNLGKAIFPNEATYYGGDGNTYLNVSARVSIGTSPAANSNFIRINQ